MNEQKDVIAEEVEAVELPAVLNRDGEIDVQVATAKQWPRDIKACIQEAEALAMQDKETAGECHYSLVKGGSKIEGPSIRLAEIIVYAWDNMRVDIGAPVESDETVSVTATVFDLQKNIAVRSVATRSILTRSGSRYGRDMVTTTGNAAASVAMRNSLFRAIPKPVWKPLYDKVREFSLTGKVSSQVEYDMKLAESRDKAFEYFEREGIDSWTVMKAINVKSFDEITMEDIATLRGMVTAVRDGEQSIQEMFHGPVKQDNISDLDNIDEAQNDCPLSDEEQQAALKLEQEEAQNE